jgi:molybdopterin synthase catalytic subunit
MTSFLQSEPIDVAALAAIVHTPRMGALVEFHGVVRDHHAGKSVASLAYSAYGPMAELVCQELVAESEDRWPVRVALRHRTGGVPIGESAVVIVVAAEHRGPAFAACEWLIEQLKRRVPIWKREHYRDGTEAWVDPTASQGIVPAGRPE